MKKVNVTDCFKIFCSKFVHGWWVFLHNFLLFLLSCWITCVVSFYPVGDYQLSVPICLGCFSQISQYWWLSIDLLKISDFGVGWSFACFSHFSISFEQFDIVFGGFDSIFRSILTSFFGSFDIFFGGFDIFGRVELKSFQ